MSIEPTPLQAHRSTPRRDFFGRVSDGLIGAALASLLVEESSSPRQANAAPATDAATDVDLFDPKPALRKHAGDVPRAFLDNVESVGAAGGLYPSPFSFRRCGQSGLPLSDLLPHLGKCADDIAVIRSMWTTSFNHEPAVFFMHGGRMAIDAPSLGSWVVYGLGSESRDLPAYVALDDPGRPILLGNQNWQSGWLPPQFQGTRLRSVGAPLANLRPATPVPAGITELSRSLLDRLAARHRLARPGVADLDARIASYDLAARMQLTATDALDLDQESQTTHEAYGLGSDVTASYGRRCLMARRLVERGVRIVQIYMNTNSGDNPWDHHGALESGLRKSCAETDQPVAALLSDLKQRGLLDSTLVVWGGEFGRLPLTQGGGKPGRDHGANGFSVWLAGGGVRGGTTYGATDEFGYHAVENRVSVHDLHATILELLGIDHEQLVYPHHGLDEKLTGVEPAHVVREILS
jgi:hypothetical protein